MTECLDEQTILAFGRGHIAPAKRRPIEKHVARCDECRALVSAVARSSFVDPEELLGGSGPPSDDALRIDAPARSGDLDVPNDEVDARAREVVAAPHDVAPTRARTNRREKAGPVRGASSPTGEGSGARKIDARTWLTMLVVLALLLGVGAMIHARRPNENAGSPVSPAPLST